MLNKKFKFNVIDNNNNNEDEGPIILNENDLQFIKLDWYINNNYY